MPGGFETTQAAVNAATSLSSAGVPSHSTVTRAWSWNRRSWFYLDRTSTVTPDNIRFFADGGGGNWVREVRGDPAFQDQTEIWYDNSAGDNDNAGTSSTVAVKNMDEVVCRALGGSSSVVLYTPAALSDAEAAIYDRLVARDAGRTWRVCNGALPYTAFVEYDASDLDLNSNVTLQDGNFYTSTWKNKGSSGATGDLTTVVGAPKYNRIASAGKCRNRSSITFNGSSYFRSGDIAGLTVPMTWVVVGSVSTTSLSMWVDGNDNTNRAAFYTNNGGWALYGGSGSGINSDFGLPTLNAFHAAVVNCKANEWTLNVNGITVSETYDAGSGMPDGITVGAGGDGLSGHQGKILHVLGLQGPLHDVGGFAGWLEYRYGTGFPQ